MEDLNKEYNELKEAFIHANAHLKKLKKEMEEE